MASSNYNYVKLKNLAEGTYISSEDNPSEPASRMSVDEALRHMETNAETGLDAGEIARRREEYQYNELQVHDDEPLWQKYLENFKDPMILLLLASVLISCLVRQWDDAVSIFAAVVIVVTVGFVQEYRSEKSLEELNRLVPHRCHVIRDGQRQDIFARDLVPGDIIICSVGDRIPADCRLIQANELQIDESMLTGESHYAHKKTEKVVATGDEVSIADRTNIAFMGTLVRNGNGRGIVVGTGEHSEFGVVFHMMQGADQRKTPLQESMDDLGKKLSIFSFGIIAVISVFGLIQHKRLFDMFTIGVSLAVAAIPEGLPIVVTVTLALGVMRMARKNAIVKKMPIVESLGSANVICADKTGTLTQNAMVVTDIYYYGNNIAAEVTGVGFEVRTGFVTVNGIVADKESQPAIAKVLQVGVLCNNSHIENGQVLGQATEGALLVAGKKIGLDDLRDTYRRTGEIPFSSATKWMATMCAEPGKPDSQAVTYMKGMIDVVLEKSATVSVCREGVFSERPMTHEDRQKLSDYAAAMAARGLRVLGLASGATVDKLCFVGLVGIVDPPRPGVQYSVQVLKKSGVHICMITGDAKETATAIANSIGIYNPERDQTLSGAQLESMSENDLDTVIESTTVFYRTSPRHKLTIIQAFQRMGRTVAMTGDGVNDAPAMRQADIGIAMGKNGTDVCKEAADMILVDDNFSTILNAVEEGKGIFFNIRNFVRFQLSTSVAAMGLVGLMNMMGYPNPLNAMQILWINIIMDGPPAQSLGVEPVDPDVMKRPPRASSDRIITKVLIQRVLTSAFLIIAGTMYVFLKEMQDGEVNARDTTMCFTTFVCFDMFNALACRSSDKSIFQIGFFTNKMFLYAVGGSLFGQLLVIYFPPLQHVFQTEALHALDLLFIVSLTSSVFWVDEIRKRRLFSSLIPSKGKFVQA